MGFKCITKVEVVKLLTIIAAMYPKFEVNNFKIELWFDMIGDLSFQVAQMAVKKVMLTSEFPPTVAQIRKAAADITSSKDGILDAGKAWGEVQRAISRYGYRQSEKAFESMSPITRKVVKQISWKEICCCEELGVIRGQFMKMFETIKTRTEEEKLLPANFKNQIELIASKMDMKQLEDKGENLNDK